MYRGGVSMNLSSIPKAERKSFLEKKLAKTLRNRSFSIEALHKNRSMRRGFKATAPWLPVGQVCYLCDQPASIRHHVVPLSHGGTNKQSNIVPLCNPCHVQLHPHMQRKTVSAQDQAGIERVKDLIRLINN